MLWFLSTEVSPASEVHFLQQQQHNTFFGFEKYSFDLVLLETEWTFRVRQINQLIDKKMHNFDQNVRDFGNKSFKFICK